MITLTYIRYNILLLATMASVAQLNQKWFDSIYEVHSTPLRRGDKYVTKENDTIELLKPVKIVYFKVRKSGKKMGFRRDTIFTFRRVKPNTILKKSTFQGHDKE
ncbi:hypothetical protein DEU42_113156 [Flavobacterium sp. AG291]|nr:hypothetical protein DEU42_113156 [Flavobacterium sp. AG291]